MKILLDMDEIIAQWVSRITQYYNEDHGTSFTLDDVKNWDVTTNFGPGSEGAIRSYMRYIELYRDLEPVEGAIVGMKKLLDAGHELRIVSSVPKCAGISYHGKLEWLRRNTPFFNLKHFIASHVKDEQMGDVLFDDGLHNIMPFVKSGRNAVVLDRPWNHDIVPAMLKYNVTKSEVRLIHRVSHWNQFLTLIDGWSTQASSKSR